MSGLLFWVWIILKYTKAVKNICIQEKNIIWLIFNLGLVSTCFQTTQPCLQQVNFDLSLQSNQKPALKSAVHLKTWSQWAPILSLWYDHKILVSRYFVLTIVKGHYKPRENVSVDLLAGVWLPSWATLSPL